MSQKIAVALIHGIGDQTPDFAEPLLEALRRELETDGVARENVVFRSIYWAPVLAEREWALWRAVNADMKLAYAALRRFVVDSLGDAVAYQPSPSRRQVYDEIHQVVAAALRQLASEAGCHAPLCVVASSLSNVTTHNYFYNLDHAGAYAELSPKAT